MQKFKQIDFLWSERDQEYTQEASTLGFPVGKWPTAFEIEGVGEFALIDVGSQRGLYALPGTSIRARIWND